ncbi:nitroreductase family deazaflavin-dependent oxidoreductase [Kribbella sp. NPDC058245]|uniref:nitroreductase family deazaflavin-dependent oxidoreductase n=1 Tax=Kribbella sp. NPDC058245 TaxID=3346399 RepID=UPI0036E22A85
MPEYQQTYDSKRVITTGAGSMRFLNRLVVPLTKLGLGLLGSRVLSVRGRKSGEWRSTPVSLIVLEGQRYLVAPRGHTQWVRNLRATPEARLQLGRTTETFRAEEIPDADKTEVLRRYVKLWSMELKTFFDGDVTKNSPDEVLHHIAPGVPVFAIHPA